MNRHCAQPKWRASRPAWTTTRRRSTCCSTTNLDYTHSNGDPRNQGTFIASLSDGTRDYVTAEPTIETLRVIGDVG